MNILIILLSLIAIGVVARLVYVLHTTNSILAEMRDKVNQISDPEEELNKLNKNMERLIGVGVDTREKLEKLQEQLVIGELLVEAANNPADTAVKTLNTAKGIVDQLKWVMPR